MQEAKAYSPPLRSDLAKGLRGHKIFITKFGPKCRVFRLSGIQTPFGPTNRTHERWQIRPSRVMRPA
ncbi:hypothetical protein [Novosphingobium percolationis]|uniref:hypothetical protein n=1 Tax=Novosphingobium percolationis TaxID=2871811 RepID=UPI001CD74108|nr:hypothetical protein [Novosphingobium percolationis]